jgi:hypothetical protein
MFSEQDIRDLYRCRWNIEIIFHAWRQSSNLDKALNRRSNEHHFQALVLAGMDLSGGQTEYGLVYEDSGLVRLALG